MGAALIARNASSGNYLRHVHQPSQTITSQGRWFRIVDCSHQPITRPLLSHDHSNMITPLASSNRAAAVIDQAAAGNLSWDMPKTIRPLRHRNGCVVLQIPAGRQKNKTDQTIPTIPDFVVLLDQTPEEDRTGWVFNPSKLRGTSRYKDVKQAGRVISAIGRKAGVIVNDDDKAAGAHDLRRSFGQRLADAGVPEYQ